MQTEPSHKSLKSQFRKDVRARRASMAEDERLARNQAINEAVMRLVHNEEPATVAAYFSFDGEPDLAPALREMAADGVRLAMPVVRDAPGKAIIVFHAWHPDGSTQNNCYGIREPEGTPLVQMTGIDMVLVPLVAWDREGRRLGMGASYYDRMFQPFAALDAPRRIGVAYDCQEVEKIPGDPWDVPLHGLVSESGLIDF
jgi:5-formyltetrahydrofolate cyclo-ligase